jgi:hypothetical protein
MNLNRILQIKEKGRYPPKEVKKKGLKGKSNKELCTIVCKKILKRN